MLERDVNSYLTVEESDVVSKILYAPSSIKGSIWGLLSDYEKQLYLLRATEMLDALTFYNSRKLSDYQSLAFPRITSLGFGEHRVKKVLGYSFYDYDIACMYQAIEEAYKDRRPDIADRVIKSERVGKMSFSYGDGEISHMSNIKNEHSICVKAYDQIKEWLSFRI